MCIARDQEGDNVFFFLSETEENLWILKLLMRTTSGVWLPGCIRLVRYHWFNLFFSRGET